MGRPERPLDPESGPVQRLACELRELRRTAGGPSYRAMAETAGFSATTLSQAAAGERLPSLAVVEGYVRACGGDPGQWAPRWEEAEAERAGSPPGEEPEGPAPYRGLVRFEPDHRHLFFGRDRVVAEVGELVCDHRFAVLFGPSGSGKSSLLRAGLIPRLQQEIADRDHPAALRILTPGPTPATSYGHLLAPARGSRRAGWSWTSSRRSSASATTPGSAPASSTCCSPPAPRRTVCGSWSPCAPTSNPRTALLLGAAAWRVAELPETRRALLGSLAQTETVGTEQDAAVGAEHAPDSVAGRGVGEGVRRSTRSPSAPTVRPCTRGARTSRSRSTPSIRRGCWRRCARGRAARV